MKFRFCGDLDCPDWVLAEIYTLSKMSFVKMKMLTQLVSTALTGEDNLDEEKAKKIVTDAKIDSEAYTMEACVAVLSSILTSSAKYNVSADVLSTELEQLGLPKEHTNALCKVYMQHSQQIRANLTKNLLRVSNVAEVKCDVPDGTKSAVLGFQLSDRIKGATVKHSIKMTPQQLAMLLSEMKTAKKVMDSAADADAD